MVVGEPGSSYFDLGFILESTDRYGEGLRGGDEGNDDEFTLVLRPNLEF
jgi:hypothetical protein